MRFNNGCLQPVGVRIFKPFSGCFLATCSDVPNSIGCFEWLGYFAPFVFAVTFVKDCLLMACFYSETKSVKKLNLNKEACEKVNASSVVANKADSKPQAKERTAQQQAVEGAGKKQSSKSCQQQKDVGVKALNQHNGLPFVNQDHVGNQNVPVKAHDKDGTPRLDECSRQPVHQKLGENENKPPLPSAASQEAVPSPSQAISDTGCEVTHTR